MAHKGGKHIEATFIFWGGEFKMLRLQNMPLKHCKGNWG